MDRPLDNGFFFKSGNEVNNHFSIHVRLENGSPGFKFAFNEGSIGEIPIMGDGETSPMVIHDKRLGVFEFTRTRRGITDMADGASSGEFLQNLFGEYFGDQTHLGGMMKLSMVGRDNPSALLTTMLKGIET